MASKYRKKFQLPEGAYQILEEYTREVLRDQPIDILEFSYFYFKALEEVMFLFHLISLLQGTIEEFDYPRKGDSIPPPKLKGEEKEKYEQQQQIQM